MPFCNNLRGKILSNIFSTNYEAATAMVAAGSLHVTGLYDRGGHGRPLRGDQGGEGLRQSDVRVLHEALADLDEKVDDLTDAIAPGQE